MSNSFPIEQASDTAFWSAACRAIESKRPDALFKDPWSGRLAGERGEVIARLMWEDGGDFWFFSIRTHLFDKLILQTVFRHGVDAVLNMGAGLDVRPYRLRLPETLRWFEADLPPVVDFMEREMERYTPNCRLERRACDLTDAQARGALFAEVGCMARKVLIVAEDVTSYFTAAQVNSLVRDLNRRPNFCYWIQDHFSRDVILELRKKWEARMPEGARLRFDHRNRHAFFQERGWKVSANFSAMDEARRLGRWDKPKRPFWQWFRRPACEKPEDLGIVFQERFPEALPQWAAALSRQSRSPGAAPDGLFTFRQN